LRASRLTHDIIGAAIKIHRRLGPGIAGICVRGVPGL
jgi:hypothetical protein